MKTYYYPNDFSTKHHNYARFFFSLGFFILLLAILITEYQDSRDDIRIDLLIILLFFFNVIYDFYQVNLYPNLVTNETGLRVEILKLRIFVPWENVISIHMIQSSYYPEKFTEWFVRTKKLTPFHLLYGKNKYGDFATGFLIRSEMENVQELLDEISSKIPVNKYQPSQKT